MGRVWHTGFETNEPFDTEWGNLSIGSNTASDVVRSGSFSYKFTTGGIPNMAATNWNFNLSEAYTRFYVRLTGVPNASVEMFFFEKTGPAAIGGINTRTDGKLDVWKVSSGGLRTTVGTSLSALPVDTWVMVEFYLKVSATIGEVRLRINGIEEVTVTSTDTGTANIMELIVGINNEIGVSAWFDDVALNSTVGSVNNSWPGEGSIVMIKPSADTATINWTAQNGGSHFAEIDDLPTSLDQVTYIKTTSTTLNLEDRWDFSDLPSEVRTDAKIKAVAFGVYGGGTGTTTRTANFRARDASANTVDGINPDWNVNGWKAVYPILIRNQTWEGSPAELTHTYINGMQGSALDTNTNNREIRWSAVWASVEYLNPEPVMQASRFFSPIPIE